MCIWHLQWPSILHEAVIVVIGVDISVHTFNHGQLYIVFSRMTSSNETIVYYYFDGNIIMQTNLSFLV